MVFLVTQQRMIAQVALRFSTARVNEFGRQMPRRDDRAGPWPALTTPGRDLVPRKGNGDGELWPLKRRIRSRGHFQSMARFPRAVGVGLAHHITQRGINRERVFFTDTDRQTYLNWFAEYAARARLRILACYLMNNHIHLVAVPEEADSLAVALRRAHSRYSLYLNTRRRRTGHLWQNRSSSCALDEAHLGAALRHVERNPVRASLVTRPEEYEWPGRAAVAEVLALRTLLLNATALTFCGLRYTNGKALPFQWFLYGNHRYTRRYLPRGDVSFI